MDELNKLGVIAPRILRKINKIRNVLEHQYKMPTKNQVEDALDISVLFLAYTNNIINNFWDEFEAESENYYFLVRFKSKIEINISNPYNQNESDNFSLIYGDTGFYEWMKFFIKIAYY